MIEVLRVEVVVWSFGAMRLLTGHDDLACKPLLHIVSQLMLTTSP